MHPLDLLTPAEIDRAVATLRRERNLAASCRFVTVTLDEPPKASVQHLAGAKSPARLARLVVLDKATGIGACCGSTRRSST